MYVASHNNYETVQSLKGVQENMICYILLESSELPLRENTPKTPCSSRKKNQTIKVIKKIVKNQKKMIRKRAAINKKKNSLADLLIVAFWCRKVE